MPQEFPQPRHPDDTPELTPMIDPEAPRTVVLGLDPTREHATSPLRRALRAAALIRRNPRPPAGGSDRDT